MRRRQTSGAHVVTSRAIRAEKRTDTVADRQRAAPDVRPPPGSVICPVCFRVVKLRPTTGLIRNHLYCPGSGTEPTTSKGADHDR